MDWFKGKSAGKPHDLHGKIYGFRLKFSQQNQSNQHDHEIILQGGDSRAPV